MRFGRAVLRLEGLVAGEGDGRLRFLESSVKRGRIHQRLATHVWVKTTMTYAEVGMFLLILSGIFALLTLCCAATALFAGKHKFRTVIAITAIICGLLSGVTYWITWSIASGL